MRPVLTRLSVTAGAAAGAAAAAGLVGHGFRRYAYDAERARLRGRLALVAGGSRGLGLLIGRDLLDLGARVVLLARDEEELRRAQATLAGPDRQVEIAVCDITDPVAVQQTVDRIQRDQGDIEVLVNVAGIISVAPLEALQAEDLERAMDTMFWGPVTLARAVLPGMRERGSGHIATVTSIGGRISVPHLLPYSAAKFAMTAFSEGLRAELSGTGVRVTTILPGLMRTGSHVQAEFGGHSDREYAWFAPGASLPLLSMDADRAARAIVRAVVVGRRELQLSLMTKVATRVHGLAPATTTALMEVVARLLPSADGAVLPTGVSTVKGFAARDRLGSALVDTLTRLGDTASQDNNEVPPRP